MSQSTTHTPCKLHRKPVCCKAERLAKEQRSTPLVHELAQANDSNRINDRFGFLNTIIVSYQAMVEEPCQAKLLV
mgnify:CR=1